ncbi:MAG: DNA mismatch repair protein MutS [Gelidibacter sp.]
MSFEIGDTVLVMDEAISGVVISVKEQIVSIETNDGFVLEFSPKELLKTNPKASLKSEIFSNQSAKAVISEKEQPTRKTLPKVKPKERNQPTMEVDLHIHQLTPNSNRMSNHEMLTLQLDTAKRQLEFAIRNRIQKIVFIHGVGEGVLKVELEYLFNRYDNIKFYDADYQKYGLGATEVYVFQNAKNS